MAFFRRAVSGVVVLGDMLRPNPDGLPGGVDGQIVWLYNAVRRQVALASGLPVELLAASRLHDIAAWVGTLRPNAAAHSFWADCFASLPAPICRDEAFASLVLDRLRGKFCIGYELPPWLVLLLDELALPYIDLRIHPVRFMDDLLFAARCSRPRSQRRLHAFAVPESEVVATASLREAMLCYLPHTALGTNTLLVVGQRPRDASQIISGRFFDAETHRAAIGRICAAHPAVLVKEHPEERGHGLTALVRTLRPDATSTTENIYRLLAQPEIAAVLSVNSSVAVEAGYFGKTVHSLARIPLSIAWKEAAPTTRAHISLDDSFLTVDFWREVLAPHARVTAHDGARLPSKPNRLRIASASFWNFQEIDTDLIPHAGSAE